MKLDELEREALAAVDAANIKGILSIATRIALERDAKAARIVLALIACVRAADAMAKRTELCNEYEAYTDARAKLESHEGER